VRWQGKSIVNLTWASPSAARLVTGWRVIEDLDFLFDYKFIVVGIKATTSEVPPQDGRCRANQMGSLQDG